MLGQVKVVLGQVEVVLSQLRLYQVKYKGKSVQDQLMLDHQCSLTDDSECNAIRLLLSCRFNTHLNI